MQFLDGVVRSVGLVMVPAVKYGECCFVPQRHNSKSRRGAVHARRKGAKPQRPLAFM